MGAWIETKNVCKTLRNWFKSHPMWVRGLKLLLVVLEMQLNPVAPHVGAWIETSTDLYGIPDTTSHPMWVRGLKLGGIASAQGQFSRTPCGCVD